MIKLKKGEVLISRLCMADGTSYNGFKWNLKIGAENSAPDFKKTKECGKGLHGWLRGEGIGSYCFYWSKNFIFVLAAVREADIVKLDGKVKFSKCRIVFAGSREEGSAILSKLYPGTILVGGISSVGDNEKVIVGDCGYATVGYGGQATAGNYGQAMAGDYGEAKVGDCGQATAGNYGQAVVGYRGQATAGNYGQATAGDYGQAMAGYRGKATAGNGGQVSAGENGIISIEYWNIAQFGVATGNIGENGLQANVRYRLDDNHSFVQAI